MGYREKARIRDLKGNIWTELLMLLGIVLDSWEALSQSKMAAVNSGTVFVVKGVVAANRTCSQYPRGACTVKSLGKSE